MPAAPALAVFATLTERRDARNPLYLQAKTCLREAILAKRVGERLPSERDLARRFGVSFMTARRAVSDLVDEGLLMRRHGKGTYVRQEGDAAGPALAIGLLAGDAPADALLVAEVRQAAQAAGFGAVTVAGRWADLVPIDPDHACARLSLAGLIGVGVTAAQAVETAHAALHLPLVLVDAEAPVAGCDGVCADHAAAARLAVEHLCQLGHRRVAFIGGGGAPAERRAIGFRLAARRLGLPGHEERLVAGADAGAIFARLLGQAPTAVVCADDAVAALCLRFAAERGLAVPRDLSLVACDTLLPAAFADPRISTVAVSRRELAIAAVKRLTRRLARGGADDAPALVPARLAVRASAPLFAVA